MGNDNSPLTDSTVKEIVSSLTESKNGILRVLENEKTDTKVKKKLTNHLIKIDTELLEIAYCIRKGIFNKKVKKLIRQEGNNDDHNKEIGDVEAP